MWSWVRVVYLGVCLAAKGRQTYVDGSPDSNQIFKNIKILSGCRDRALDMVDFRFDHRVFEQVSVPQPNPGLISLPSSVDPRIFCFFFDFVY
mgnify:CR=1 FL=1